MANTYTQLYTQFIFAPKFRLALIRPEWEDELYKYVTGIVQNRNNKMMAINGMPDHVHIFISMHPTESPSTLVREIKKASTDFIKKEKLSPQKFQWQEGFGAFSYGKSQKERVVQYVRNQKEHHRKRSFREEYLALLKAFEIDFKTEYLFDFFD